MLDKDTKTTIQNARDVLVGKVPNPVSQIDLITTAMIYKFMDDMDLENIEFGGKRVFFTDDLEPYAWSKLMNPKLGHYDRISLYAEALDKLQVAKQIPDLFRRIFKGAFLPFRDGATLTLFLNEINQLKYDNSENLGDAFEFLLSVMGSQGDAGQFRTPRHIIDFIVDVVNPLKTDSILDPACGTAGFLISAYKHIINQAKQEGKLLTPAEMKDLTNNINGYDISPDMVKLASVNLFLHQFKQPHIYEYDTLSSDVRWDEKFDVILANPPFMTPKGGIMPHSRFGVKSNRSEVLFVDYFMEHLNINGKAGFVIPEGIIFQSANAYKSLRKMMVEENYLYAVVSLPSGVFNPYAGVKTSILFFDKTLAKKTDKILFVKIDNDGFDLGAQRRPIKENDIPKALEALKAYQNSIEQNTEFDTAKYGKCLLVSKDKIRENGEYNLTVSRYEETKDYTNCQYEMVKLGDITTFISGFAFESKYLSNEPQEGFLPIVKIGNISTDGKIILKNENTQYHNYNEAFSKYMIEKDDLIVAMTGATVGKVAVSEITNALLNQRNGIIRATNKANCHYLKFLLISKKFYQYCQNNAGGGAQGNISPKQIKDYEIPLPPLEVQEEIVKELDQYQAIIDGAQKVVDNWKPTFTINPNWKKVPFIEQIENVKYTNKIQNNQFLKKGKYPIIDQSEKYIAGYWNDESDVFYIKKPVVIFGDHTKHIKYIDFDFVLGADGVKILQPNMLWDPKFFYYTLLSIKIKNLGYARHFKELKEKEMYRPPLEEQKAIVAKIEQEEQYVDACKKLIEINQQKISNKINSIWNNNNE